MRDHSDFSHTPRIYNNEGDEKQRNEYKIYFNLSVIMAMASVGIVSQGEAGGTNNKPQCGYYHYHYDDHVWHWHSKDCPIKQQP